MGEKPYQIKSRIGLFKRITRTGRKGITERVFEVRPWINGFLEHEGRIPTYLSFVVVAKTSVFLKRINNKGHRKNSALGGEQKGAFLDSSSETLGVAGSRVVM